MGIKYEEIILTNFPDDPDKPTYAVTRTIIRPVEVPDEEEKPKEDQPRYVSVEQPSQLAEEKPKDTTTG